MSSSLSVDHTPEICTPGLAWSSKECVCLCVGVWVGGCGWVGWCGWVGGWVGGRAGRAGGGVRVCARACVCVSPMLSFVTTKRQLSRKPPRRDDLRLYTSLKAVAAVWYF